MHFAIGAPSISHGAQQPGLQQATPCKVVLCFDRYDRHVASDLRGKAGNLCSTINAFPDGHVDLGHIHLQAEGGSWQADVPQGTQGS